MEKIIFFIFLFFFNIPSFGNVLASDDLNEPLRHHLLFYHDTTGKLNIDDIKHKKFNKINPNGFYKGTVWARTEVCNPNNNNIHFIYKDPISLINIYLGNSSTPVKYTKINQSGFSNDYWVNLELEIHKCETIWIMFKSGDAMSLAPSLVSPNILKRMIAYYNLFYAAYYLFLSIIFLISLILLFKYKDKLYFYFCSLVITQDFLGTSLLNGFLFYYFLKPIASMQYDVGNLFALLMNISVVMFATTFLEEKNKFNKIISKIYIIFQSILVMPIVINFFVHIHNQNIITSYLVNQSILIGFFWVLYLGFFNFRSIKGKILLLASGPKLAGQIIKTLLLQGSIHEHMSFFSIDMSFILFNISAIGSLYEAVFIILFLINSYIKNMENKNIELKETLLKLKQSEIDTALINLSKQLAHDIRSPLAAINTALSDVSAIPENKRILIKSAAKRINDIANNLLFKHKSNLSDSENCTDETLSHELIFVALENIVSEKRLEYQHTKIDIQFNIFPESYNCFAKINLTSFKRVLSNLINNSIESLSNSGTITISLECQIDQIRIVIQDTGCGIQPHILSDIFKQGFTYNKKNGAGLGLSYAKHYIEQLSGSLTIQSELDVGTAVTIILNKSNQANWFCNSICITDHLQTVILDDDPSIHDAWNEKFEDFSGRKLIHFYKASDLIEKYSDIKHKTRLYLIDYELLNDTINGLDVMQQLGINEKSFLVTSCFEDISVRERANQLAVKIIPKSYVPYIPIQSTHSIEKNQIVFIDDDELMRATWIFAAKAAGINLSTYGSFSEFIKVVDQYDKNVLIYIDSDLGEETKGESYAKKLFEHGFTEIHLCTGHVSQQFGNMPWIKSIIGKEFPFIRHKELS